MKQKMKYRRNTITTSDAWQREKAQHFIAALEYGSLTPAKALRAMKPFGVGSANTLQKIIQAARAIAAETGRRIYTTTRPTEYELIQALPFCDPSPVSAAEERNRYEMRNEPLT